MSDESSHFPFRFMPGGEFGRTSLSFPDGLNDKLKVEHLDIQADDNSWCAKTTRLITRCTSRYFSPSQILLVLRVLKALTFCFLVMTMISNMMYILFVKIISNRDSIDFLEEFRDTILRIYGLFLTFFAMMLELDISRFIQHISGLKSFIPRGLLIFFISFLTNTSPQLARADYSSRSNNNYGDDDYNNLYDDYEASSSDDIPVSAIVFQMVTSWALACCGFVYIILGLLCCDRFTSKAFLSSNDPLVSTAIPPTRPPSRISDLNL